MQYKVPQGVEMQDRILGPLTLIQFGFLLFGGLVAYFVYLKLPKPFGFWGAIGFFSLSMLVSFDNVRRMIVASIFFITRPRSRVWHKVNAGPASPITPVATSVTKKKKALAKKRPKKYRDISELANILDTHGHEEGK